MALEKINQVNDIKKLEKYEWNLLAEEIREFLIEKISVSGGHLASNLGVVELTMAMHLAFHLPEDKFLFLMMYVQASALILQVRIIITESRQT